MRRRRLILTSLGALAGAFGLKGVPFVSAAPVPPDAALGRDTVFTSREAAAAIETVIRDGVPLADLFVSESAVVSGALRGLDKPPLVSIGTLIIGTVAEQDAFLQLMSDAILESSRRA